jgi:hypothetical protein
VGAASTIIAASSKIKTSNLSGDEMAKLVINNVPTAFEKRREGIQSRISGNANNDGRNQIIGENNRRVRAEAEAIKANRRRNIKSSGALQHIRQRIGGNRACCGHRQIRSIAGGGETPPAASAIARLLHRHPPQLAAASGTAMGYLRSVAWLMRRRR